MYLTIRGEGSFHMEGKFLNQVLERVTQYVLKNYYKLNCPLDIFLSQVWV